ncbi:hypothetical protein R5N98_12580 [Tenacibaculum maritimum]|uniref:hypothetical protein n=1 Tax=Tenacibaculum maritimum TaxID=107401 RepID=UPI00388F4DCC
MNDLLPGLYEGWFDYESYQFLFRSVFKEQGFGLIGWAIIVLSISLLVFFYKFWDPVEGQRKKWILILLINSLLIFGVSYLILYNNQGLIQAMGNFVEGEGVNPHSFVFQISAISALYGLGVAFICCIFPLPVKILSNDNKHNPF